MEDQNNATPFYNSLLLRLNITRSLWSLVTCACCPGEYERKFDIEGTSIVLVDRTVAFIDKIDKHY